MSNDVRTNWAGNLTYSAGAVARPGTPEELADLVGGSDRIKALGSRHSFCDVADTTGTHVLLDVYDDGRPAVVVDAATGVASLRAGLLYGQAGTALLERGRALRTMASLPHISLAGAIATATHGSGDANGCLASDVVGLEIVTADGEARTLRRGDADFPGAVVGLGALGVVTRVEMATDPAFEVSQDVVVDLPWEALLTDLEAVTGAAYSVSAFTLWDEDAVSQVWLKSRVAGSSDGQAGDATGERRRPARDVLLDLGARDAPGPMHPLAGEDPAASTVQGGVPGPAHERLPHFRAEHKPSTGAELQSEYLVPREHAAEAIEAMRELGPKVAPLLFASEIRTVAGDDLWLSPFDGATLALHFTWKPDDDAVRAVLHDLEAALLPWGARPHWGKIFVAKPAELAAMYPRFDDFAALAQRLDPRGKFRGGYLTEILPA
ncbi:D-arabinono-1,4-lactone oxidase [Myceligenerans pegani]|uniref:FAD-binding protein n=1 Tax=Myceligenerans pegani TaxID=2776917 RepID=A0ABR9N075_9MICO|nr:D-arabinono-1,4-lactone oxidase [Myceligenerans sp. TRM 65318]MBE1877055.1 FAD-binding protein [Myceligenerans sp. TRM 65318]MBE3019326.1 FAD-binding protein [Myceligenerans sp. TRM 65318]